MDLDNKHKFDIDSKNLQESNEIFENPKQNTKSIVKFKVDDRPNNEEASIDDLDSNKLYNLDFKEDLKEDLEEFNWNLNVDLNPDSKHQKTKDNIINKHLNKNTSKKPKLAIIIDDLAMPKDIEAFKVLDLKLNLSLFPQHVFSRHNSKMAKELEFYMIHLPLEANEFKQKGVRVINTGDSIEVIESYIKEIKQDFPNLRYINNHTGNRYTSSK
ncbi:Divergent polysaccharide deacetylase [Helicobacter muridarum]|nr:Divergent polysaccharide deacetylase [Helicobacter muridarum]